DPQYQLLDFGPGQERARVLFPRSCTSHGAQYNALRQLSVREDRIIAEVWEQPFGPLPPSVFYTLDHQLHVQHVGVSDRYRIMHEQLAEAGTLDHDLLPAEIDRLAHAVQMLPGTAGVGNPAHE